MKNILGQLTILLLVLAVKTFEVYVICRYNGILILNCQLQALGLFNFCVWCGQLKHLVSDMMAQCTNRYSVPSCRSILGNQILQTTTSLAQQKLDCSRSQKSTCRSSICARKQENNQEKFDCNQNIGQETCTIPRTRQHRVNNLAFSYSMKYGTLEPNTPHR